MPAHALLLDPAHPIDPSAVGVLDRPGPADAGPPVVLLHGWTGSKEDFSAVVDALSADRRVLVPDLPGQGDTPAIGGESAQAAAFVPAFPLSFISSVFVPPDSVTVGWLAFIARNSPVSATADAARGMAVSGPVLQPLLLALGWSIALLCVFVPLSVARFRRLE